MRVDEESQSLVEGGVLQSQHLILQVKGFALIRVVAPK